MILKFFKSFVYISIFWYGDYKVSQRSLRFTDSVFGRLSIENDLCNRLAIKLTDFF